MNREVDLRQLVIDRSEETGPTLKPRRRVLSRYVLPGLLLLGFLGLLGWASWDVVFPPRPVTVVPVLATRASMQREGTPLFQAAGWIEPRPTPVRVAALAPGFVERLLVVEDQSVKAGEPVAELVKDDAQLAYDRASADLKLREAEHEEAQASLRAAITRFDEPVHLEAPLREAESALAKIETQLRILPFEIEQAAAQSEFAKQDYEGKQSVEGAVAGRTIAGAKSRMRSAGAFVAGLRDREKSLENERAALAAHRDAIRKQLDLLVDETKAKEEAASRLKAAAARVGQARVSVAEAKLRLDRMTVRAPVEGRVLRLVADPGTRLMVGMGHTGSHDGSTVITMYQPLKLQIRVDVRFEDLPQVRIGQPVRIANPALNSPLTGRVLRVSSEADIQKNTLEVKIEIESPSNLCKPEMLVDVTFLAPRESAPSAKPTANAMRLYIPQQYVQQSEEGTFVWLADQTAKTARKKLVQTGGTGHDGLVEITSGLTLSSRIIASGRAGLVDGDRIRITGEDPIVSSVSP